MPAEDEIHRCPILEYEGKYLQYCCAGQDNARWRLIGMRGERPSSHDFVKLDPILFCPCCGQDFRQDTGTHHAGRPQLSELLADAVASQRDSLVVDVDVHLFPPTSL